MNRGWSRVAIAGLAMAVAPAWAEVTVTQAWVGPTLPKLKAAGVYMKLTSTRDVLLVSAASPAAGIVEIHEMTTGGGVVAMRSIDENAIPAGTTVELKPGGYPVKLFELVRPLAKGDKVPVTLTFRGKDGTVRQAILAEVLPRGAPPAQP